jgi:hypothetical protein
MPGIYHLHAPLVIAFLAFALLFMAARRGRE